MITWGFLGLPKKTSRRTGYIILSKESQGPVEGPQIRDKYSHGAEKTYEPGSKLLVLGMVIQPLIGNPYNGYIKPYYWVDDIPL